MTWEEGRLKQRRVKLPERNYELIIYRELEDGGKKLKVVTSVFISRHVHHDVAFLMVTWQSMKSQSTLYRDLKGKTGEVQAYSYFQYLRPELLKKVLHKNIEIQHSSYI